MPVTRNQPRVEFSAAVRHLFRALVAGVVALVLVRFDLDLQRFLIEMAGGATWRGIAFVPTVALVAGILASVFLASAIGRISRWLTALKHVRMLKNPQQVALVPPLPSHLQSLTPTLGRQVRQWFGILLFAAAMVGAVALLKDVPTASTADDPEDPFLVLAGAVFLLLGSLYGLIDTVPRWRRARRAAKASGASGLPVDISTRPSVERAAKIPPLTVTFSVPAAVARDHRVVTGERNVFGRPPWNIAYLRLFDNEGGFQQFLKDGWRQYGYVHFIRDVDSVSRDELRAIEDGARVFIDSRERLLADLDSRPSEALPVGERRFDCIAAEGVEVRDLYGSYPVYAALCHDSFWKAAVDVLLDRADVVVLDLSGYHWDNLGTGYELQRVIDRFPIERCVFMAAAMNTDKAFLEAQIRRAWSQMAGGSPNGGDAPRQVIVAQAGLPGGGTNSAASLLQERLELAAPYVARVKNMSALGAAEQARLEVVRQQAMAARKRRPIS
jgi:hypothetical protein